MRAAAGVDAAEAEDPAYLRKIIDAAETKDEEEGLLQAKLEKLAMQIGVFGTVPFPPPSSPRLRHPRPFRPRPPALYSSARTACARPA